MRNKHTWAKHHKGKNTNVDVIMTAMKPAIDSVSKNAIRHRHICDYTLCKHMHIKTWRIVHNFGNILELDGWRTGNEKENGLTNSV